MIEIFEDESSIKELVANDVVYVVNAGLKFSKSPNTDLLVASTNKLLSDFKDNPEVVSCASEVLAAVASGKHPDLLYGSAILVSTVMNSNDDIFLPEETWKARYTPINTPFNENHVKKNIRGHIIGTQFLDFDGNIIEDDPEGETKVPDYFDIDASFVVYKNIFPDFAEHLLDDASEGKTMVSMECKIGNFDYGLIDPNDEEAAIQIVKRTKQTAFLTRYLRAYDGTGTYDKYIIGRVLRNIRFTGMGDVAQGANPTSYYTSLGGKVFKNIEADEIIECISIAEGSSKDKPTYYFVNTKGNEMPKVENLEQAIAEIDRLNKENQQLQAAEVQKQLDELKASVETLKKSNEELNNKLIEAEGKYDVTENARKELETQLAEANKNLDSVKAELRAKQEEAEKLEASKRGTSRLNELKELGMTFDDEAKACDMYASMTDEVYAQIKSVAEKVKVNKVTETNPEEQAEATLGGAKENEPADLTAGGSAPAEEVKKVETATIIARALSASRNKSKKKLNIKDSK